VAPEQAEGKRSATTSQTSGSEAPSREQPTAVEASSTPQTSPQASAQRLAQRGAVEPSAARSSADPDPETPDVSIQATPSEAGTRRERASTRGGRKISLEDEFVIEGKLEKPSAYYILRRSTLDYDWARLGARFSPLVLESVQDPLF
jgi:hypothetical protein